MRIGGIVVDKYQQFYRCICAEIGREALSDEEIAKIALFLQRRLGQPGDAADLSLGQLVHVDPDPL